MRPDTSSLVAVKQLMWLLLLILGNVLITSGKSNSVVSESHMKAKADLVSSVHASINHSKSNEVSSVGVGVTNQDAAAAVINQSKVVLHSRNHSSSHLPASSANHTTSVNHSKAVVNTTLNFTTTVCNSTNGRQLKMEFSSSVLENGMYPLVFSVIFTCTVFWQNSLNDDCINSTLYFVMLNVTCLLL
jgi:hypothetical protein